MLFRSDLPFGSGLAISKCSVSKKAVGKRRSAKYVQKGELSGQCGYGKLLRTVKIGTAIPADVPIIRRVLPGTDRFITGPPYCHGMYCRYSSVRSASRQRHSPCRAARSALATMPLFTRAVFIWFRGCLPASSRRGPCPASAAQSNAPLRTDTAFQTPQSPFC